MAEISLREYCQQIENAIGQGHYAEAVAHGKHILKHYPKHVTIYRLLGKAMLEAGQDEYAGDMFRRVLSADPEDMLAWAGMSEIHDRRGELDAAVWYLERAFELATDNRVVAEELRHLYGRRDGVEPQRVQLTRGALAGLYFKGDLLSRAIGEFRALLAEHPERVDLSVALAEALWRNEQRLEASEVCQQVLDELPYCLKANLILGEIWTSSGREEGEVYLRRAEALDPENRMAQELFGAASPLPAREVWIAPLEYQPPTEEERPAWMAEVEAIPTEGPPLTEREAALVDITAALEAQIEIPPWLEEISVGEGPPPPAPPSPAAPSEEQPPEEIPAPAEEFPAWLVGLREEFIEERPEEETPEWLIGLGLEPIGEEEVPAWLASLREQFAEEVEAPEEAPAPAEEVPLPAWLEGEGLPSGDEALAWLEQLAAGKEEELRAWAETEAEARMAEIMGRPRPAEPSPEKAAPEEAVVPPVEEVPPLEPAFGWTAFGEPEAPPEEIIAPPVKEAPPAEPAFGWTAFGEPEAPPEAVPAVEEARPIPEAPEWTRPEEVEAPPVVEFPVVEEVLPPEEIPAPEVAPPPEEVPGVVEMEIPEVREEVAAPLEIPTVEAPAEPFAAERAYLKEHPRDYEAWLALAQALWQAGEREEALEAYTRVIRAGKFLESVIPDLEECVEQWPDVGAQRVLGDAYMKDGQLQEALDIYRRALASL